MNRARSERRAARHLVPLAILVAALVVVGCGTAGPTTTPQGSLASPSGAGPVGPSGSSVVTAPPGTSTNAPSPTGTSPGASNVAAGCSGSANNLAFYAQAASAMSWAVYCAVLPTGWILDSGNYRLANGGQLDAIYRGPGNAHLAIAEGNVCDGVSTDVNVCAPRDRVIGSAALGDRTGELGQLANGLVLDVDRGANPSWRVTGLGIARADFIAFCAAMLRVGPGG